MTAYKNMTLDQRRAEYAALQTAFEDLKAQGLKLDMTRGKPCKDQLDMVSDIFDMLKEPEDYIVDGIDIRNYGSVRSAGGKAPVRKHSGLQAQAGFCRRQRQFAVDVRRD